VRVRVIGIEVVHGGPLDVALQVLFDARHEASDVRRHVEFVPILRSQNDPELMRFPRPWLFKGFTSRLTFWPVKDALRPIEFDPVALDVPQMERGGFRSRRGELDVVYLHDHASRVRARRPSLDARARTGARVLLRSSRAREAHPGEHSVPKRCADGARARFSTVSEARPENSQFVGAAHRWI
jgi:hypothetical protein